MQRSHLGRLFRLLRTSAGITVAVTSLAVAVTGRTVNGLSFDTASPAIAASIGLTCAAFVYSGYVEQRTVARIVRAVFPGGEELRRPLADFALRVRTTWLRMWKAIGLMAVSVAAMLYFMLLGLGRLDEMGTVSATMFTGPLALSVVGLWKTGRNRLLGSFLITIASTGLICLTRPWEGRLDPLGLLFAATAGAAYAAYFVALRRMRRIDESALRLGSALATSLGAGLTVTITGAVLWFSDGMELKGFTPVCEDWLTWRVVGIAAGAALLSNTVALMIQAEVFRRELVTVPAMSILTSLEPALGALAGWAILDQRPIPLDWIGILMVCGAGFACAYLLERGRGATTGDD